MSKTNKSKPAPIATVAASAPATDPRVVEILAIHDRVALHPTGDHSAYLMERLCGFDHEWPAYLVRPVLVAFLDALLARDYLAMKKDGDIDEALKIARDVAKFAADFEAESLSERARAA